VTSLPEPSGDPEERRQQALATWHARSPDMLRGVNAYHAILIAAEELGITDEAIAWLREVAAKHPDIADAMRETWDDGNGPL
jgi:hypothetical protein